MPKVALSGEGLGILGILGILGNIEGIIGNMIIVPNVANVERQYRVKG